MAPELAHPERDILDSFNRHLETEHAASGGRLILSRRESGRAFFLLRDLNAGTTTELPFTAILDENRLRAYSRVDGPYVLFTDFDANLDIFDTQTKQTRTITHPQGVVVSATVSRQTGDVLYQVRRIPGGPKVFIRRSGEEKSILVTKALPGEWSPDGRFFTLKRWSPIEEAWSWWIYNKELEPVANLGEFGASNSVEWAPTSDKITYEATFAKPSFYLLHLDRSPGDFRVSRVEYVKPPSGWSYSNVHWSPDGRRIAFDASRLGDETGDESTIRVLDLDSGEHYLINVEALPFHWSWKSRTKLYAEISSNRFAPKSHTSGSTYTEPPKLLVEYSLPE